MSRIELDVHAIMAQARRDVEALQVAELEAAGVHARADLFFPVVTYPPLTMLPPLEEQALFSQRTAGSDEPVTAYLHIPFCLTRCTFCHWTVVIGSGDEDVTRYLDYLDRELRMQRERLGVERVAVSSVLVGGGTPSFLSPRHLRRFMEIVHDHYDLGRCAQLSFEPEPSTMLGDEGLERIRILREYGVDRVSMGVQAFDDGLLKRLGRHHDADQALQAIARLREGGIPSVSIDLIYGLPDQTTELWTRTMLRALESGADAWQLYRLRILPHGDQPGHVVQQFRKRPELFPGDDDALLMKQIGIRISEEHGFPERYTRIFARTDADISFYLRDVNVALSDVMGAGISAWSSLGRVFALNAGTTLADYYGRIDRGRLPCDRGLARDADDEARRSFILPLKNQSVDRAAFAARTGTTVKAAFGPALDRLRALGLVEEDATAVRLTRRGRFFADDVCRQLFAPRYLPPRALAAAQ